MAETDDTSDRSDDNENETPRPSDVADGLASQFGTPGWSALLELGERCLRAAGCVDADLDLLASTLTQAICEMKMEAGALREISLPHGRWLMEPNAEVYVKDIVGTAFDLMNALHDPPPPLRTEAASALFQALEDFMISSLPEATEEDLQELMESRERRQEGPPRKERRASDARILTCHLAEQWETITGCLPDAWRDPVSGDGRGRFWIFVTEVCKALAIKAPHAHSVEVWMRETLTKITERPKS
jgi:hypothetical protein